MAEDKQERITLEYLFRGDAPPDDLVALDVACAVYSRGACIIADIDLAAMRTRLEERGYEQNSDIAIIKKSHIGTYWPAWCEMWIKECSV